VASSIDEELAKVKNRKDRLHHKERILLERARRRDAKRLTEVGKLAKKANIHQLDPDVLLGAFLEIGDLMDQQKNREKWLERAALASNIPSSSASRIVVRFVSKPTEGERKLLQDQSFRWNAFREEFYGRGDMEAIRTLLEDSHCMIEAIDE